MNMENWYTNLVRPEWAPPAWLFSPVWTVLYTIIFISFGYVFYQISQGRIPLIVGLPFVLNLLFNAAFTPVQFWLQLNWLALGIVALVVATLLWAMVAIWPYAPWVALVNIPYALWGTFATILQASITYLNW